MNIQDVESIVTCTPRTVRKYLMRCIEADVVPMLVSSPGMGKSSIQNSLADYYNLALIDERMSTSIPENMSGLPRFREDGKAEFVPFADIFPTEDTPLPEGKDGWLIHLDEFNSAAREMQAASYKLVLDKMIGQRKLHPNVKIVMSGNLATDRAIVNTLSTAMQSRLIHIEMRVDFDEWLEDVAIPQKYPSQIIAFLSAYPQYLMDFNPAHTEKTFCCPRTWEFVKKLMYGIDGVIPTDLTTLFAGTITKGVAIQFVNFTAVYSKMIAFSDIVNAPELARIPDNPELTWAVVSMLSGKLTMDNYKNVFAYVERLPLTFKILFYRTATSFSVEIEDTPEWRKAIAQLGRAIS